MQMTFICEILGENRDLFIQVGSDNVINSNLISCELTIKLNINRQLKFELAIFNRGWAKFFMEGLNFFFHELRKNNLKNIMCIWIKYIQYYILFT